MKLFAKFLHPHNLFLLLGMVCGGPPICAPFYGVLRRRNGLHRGHNGEEARVWETGQFEFLLYLLPLGGDRLG